MTDQENVNQEKKENDKELNFRALEAKHQRELQHERAARLEAEKKAQELQEMQSRKNQIDDDDDDEPYVNKKILEKKLNKFGDQAKQQTKQEIDIAVKQALAEEKKSSWLAQNQDFYDIINKHASRFVEQYSQVASGLAKIPDEFERQRAAYESIKALGLDKPEKKQSSIQDTINANQRSPYYQPSSVGAAPYSNGGDFSPEGQKNAHKKMKELQARLRG